MVPGSHHINAKLEKVLGQSRCDAEAGRGVFAVSQHEIDAVLADQPLELFADDVSPRTSKDVTNEENFHADLMVSNWKGEPATALVLLRLLAVVKTFTTGDAESHRGKTHRQPISTGLFLREESPTEIPSCHFLHCGVPVWNSAFSVVKPGLRLKRLLHCTHAVRKKSKFPDGFNFSPCTRSE